MKTSILTDNERASMRAQGLCSSLTMLGRTLTPYRELRVAMAPVGNFPAFTQWITDSAPRVNIGKQNMRLREAADYVRAVGLFYHEAGHVLFTPSQYKMSVPNNLHAAYNILEDARTERLVIGMYPSVEPYLRALVAHFILTTDKEVRGSASMANEDSAPLSIWPLVCGRTYMPQALRQKAKSEFVRAMHRHGYRTVEYTDHRIPGFSQKVHTVTAVQAADLFEELALGYLPLVLPVQGREHSALLAVLGTFQSLMAACRSNHADANHHGSDMQSGSSNGKSENTDGQRQAQKRASEKEEAEGKGKGTGEKSEKDADDDAESAGAGESAESDDTDEDAEGESDGGNGEGDDGADSDDGGEGDGGQGQGDGAGEDDTEGDDEAKSGKGAGSGNKAGSSEVEFDESLGDLDLREMSQAISSAVTEEFGEAASRMGDNDTNTTTVNPRAIRGFNPGPSVIMEATQFETQIRRLQQQVEPGWETRRPSGRLNVQRAMTGETPIDELFDEWSEGRVEDSRTEVVILLDQSTSMSESMTRVCEQAWAIKRAGDRLRNPTTGIVYNTAHAILWPAAQKVPNTQVPGVGSQGDTNPTSALRQAAIIFERSKCKHRVLICLTDGAWQGASECEAVVERIKRAGVTTILVNYENSWGFGNLSSHRFDTVVKANDPKVLVDVARAAVSRSVESEARRGRRTV